jgi:hypothetical protein
MRCGICERIVAAYADGDCADCHAGFLLLWFVKQGPGEKDWALVIMRQCLAADWTRVGREVQNDVQLRQYRNDELNTLLLLA